MATQRKTWLISIAIFVILIAAVVLASYRFRKGPSAGRDALRAGDYATAAHLLQGLADKGDAPAQFALGVLYADGRGIVKDEVVAASHFRRAAQTGHAGAAYRLARLYESGRGVAEDHSAAFRWYLYAAQQGEAAAQYKVASLYYAQRQAPENLEKARQWYQKAGAQGHAEAQYALSAMTTESVPVGAARIAIVATQQPMIAEVEYLDGLARQAQLNFADQFANAQAHFRPALHSLIDTEVQLSQARDQAWQAMPFTKSKPVDVSQPLKLAMLALHIEVRRFVGPTLRTRVPGLVDAPGCKADLIQNRILYTYASAAIERQSTAEVKALGEFARQVACLGRRQLVYLEQGVSRGFDEVASEMKARGLETLIPSFAQIVAPLQVLILDARKHRGEKSYAWQWFHTQFKNLTATHTAWGTGNNLYLWSRSGAYLVGYPMCAPGRFGPNCVNLRVFLTSLTDPRAIGLGDCALSGMIENGPAQIGGQQLYVCPSLTCGQQAGTSSGQEKQEALARLQSRWPSSSPDSVLVQEGQGTGQLCRNPASLTLQSSGPAPEECTDDLFGQNKNPWDNYAACMADAVGGGDNNPQQDVGQLPGIPTGTKCGLVAEDGEKTPPPPPKTPPPADPAKKEGEESKEETPPPTKTSDTAPDLSQVPDKAKDKQGIGDWLWGWIRGSATGIAGGRAGERERQENSADLIRHTHQGSQDCFDLAGCPDTCTGLGSQIAKTNACTKDLLDALGRALGRNRPGPQPGQKIPPHPFVSLYDPDHAPVPESNAGACSSGDTGSSVGPNPCQFTLCAGIASSSDPVAGGCSCGQGGLSFKPVTKSCAAVDCPDGIHGDNCQCLKADLQPNLTDRTFFSTPNQQTGNKLVPPGSTGGPPH